MSETTKNDTDLNSWAKPNFPSDKGDKNLNWGQSIYCKNNLIMCN